MRYLTEEIRRFLLEDQKMAFIAGPRQVGKTTLVKHLLHQSGHQERYFNWDVRRDQRRLIADAETFWKSPEDLPERNVPWVALDEIHKYPRWKRFLKGLYDDQGKNIRILVTGSGRLDVYQRGGDSLAGRYGLYRLHPFTLGELLTKGRAQMTAPGAFWNVDHFRSVRPGATEGLDHLERFSGFPEPLFSESAARLMRWKKAHRDLVIREDLRDLTRIRELGLLESLIALLPERIASPLSLNALSEDLQVAHGTVRVWIQALARLYVLFELRPFTGPIARALRREAKVYLYDVTEITDPGARFENLVALHLRKAVDAWNDWGYGRFDLHYVRNKEKKEVDFLITDHLKPLALIEAKVADAEVDSSLRYYAERLKPKYTIQLVRDLKHARTFQKPDIWVLPAAAFLSQI